VKNATQDTIAIVRSLFDPSGWTCRCLSH